MAVESAYAAVPPTVPSCVPNALPGVVRTSCQSTPTALPLSHAPPSEIGFSVAGKLVVYGSTTAAFARGACAATAPPARIPTVRANRLARLTWLTTTERRNIIKGTPVSAHALFADGPDGIGLAKFTLMWECRYVRMRVGWRVRHRRARTS